MTIPVLKLNKDIQFDLWVQIYTEQIADAYTQILRDRLDANFATLKNVTWREMRVLGTLTFFDESLSPKQISDVVRCDPATATRSIKNLARHDLVSTQTNPDDTRSKLVTLTVKGRELAEEHQERVTACYEEIGQDLGFDMTPAERDMTLTLLKKFRDGLYTVSESPVLPEL